MKRNARLFGTIIVLSLTVLVGYSASQKFKHNTIKPENPCQTSCQQPNNPSLPAPTSLIASATSDNQIQLSWNIVNPINNYTVSYNIYRNNVLIGTSNITSYTDAGLSPSTTYTYYVSDTDSNNDIGGSSSTVSATTLSVPKSNCFTAAQAWSEIGSTGCVTFTGYSYISYSGQMYLDQNVNDYANGFSVWIPAGESFGSSILEEYSGVPINVSGTISSYNGAPEIEVTDASQITPAQ